MAWYDAVFVQTGRSPALWALVGFLITFAVVRTVTRRIHARQVEHEDTSGPVRDVYIGGVHVHHQVWGILLVLVSGLLTFRFRPESPWIDVLALLFGAGAALTLDEFALWFHLDDVYWSTDGRKSIDAILVGGALGGAILLAVSPVGTTNESNLPAWLYSILVATHLAFALVCVLKGKLATGILGVVVPTLAWIGAARLAKPESYWARRRYRGTKLDRSRHRFGPAYQARRDRLRDLLGGAPADGPGGTPGGPPSADR
ncbi:hypothetical protein [Cellulomonas terrae]|uniref:Integral membrane protein n=1 Tax=Cellulomonas terrae TaxID=311234 RepID=A0A511JGV7_9CELL|nr:hypothetical protein [Cellulomonas terrae]GEL97069.1 hypothetical protein CTE05_06160 [Cellulomonas terrae]